jgi:Lanthionine synthetase C-like protein.
MLYNTEEKHSLSDFIYEKISSNIHLMEEDNGLLEGKMGMVLFLYRYARVRNAEKAREKADALIDEIWESVHLNELPFFFYKGHSGITRAFCWLEEKKYRKRMRT